VTGFAVKRRKSKGFRGDRGSESKGMEGQRQGEQGRGSNSPRNEGKGTIELNSKRKGPSDTWEK